MKKRSLNRFISLITSFAAVLSFYHFFSDSIIKTNSIMPSVSVSADRDTIAESDGISDNPYNRQNDMEVAYDGSRWVQPKEWNKPKISPKDYKGGIMLYFDKIGLDPEYARGKVQSVYFCLTGATEPVSHIKFHFFYDTRLTVRNNTKGELLNKGRALNDFTTGSAMVEEGELVFNAYSDEAKLIDGCLFTVDFIVPENAEQGDVYPFGLSYVTDDAAPDTFIDSEQKDAGKLQMTYVFTKGIHSGYIKINGAKKTTTAATTAVTTTTTTEPVPAAEYKLGDVNDDGLINSVDASSVLAYYARVSTKQDGGYTEEQQFAADADSDGQINAVDASNILAYYSYVSTTKEGIISFENYMKR